MDIGKIIKSARLARGLTQEELAEKVGVQKSAIAKWENGRVINIKRNSLIGLAEALDLQPLILLGDVENDPIGVADTLADLFQNLDEGMKQMLQEYTSLDDVKQKQVQEYVHLLFMSSQK